MNTNAASLIIASCFGRSFRSSFGARALSRRHAGSRRRFRPFSERFYPEEVSMKTKLLLSLMILILACGSAVAQFSTELQQVTLYDMSKPQHDESRSSINFETGKRGSLRA